MHTQVLRIAGSYADAALKSHGFIYSGGIFASFDFPGATGTSVNGINDNGTIVRSGDRNANDVSGLLVLKTIVEKYSPGSETRRAVTTVTGATKLKVYIQLVTRDGRVVLERGVEGDVRFIGDNLRATNKVANNTAKILKRTSLPAAPVLTSPQRTSKEATATI